MLGGVASARCVAIASDGMNLLEGRTHYDFHLVPCMKLQGVLIAPHPTTTTYHHDAFHIHSNAFRVRDRLLGRTRHLERVKIIVGLAVIAVPRSAGAHDNPVALRCLALYSYSIEQLTFVTTH